MLKEESRVSAKKEKSTIDRGRRFEQLPVQQRMLFVAYFTYGYPDAATSMAVMRLLLDAGVDVLEVGYPFSDPVADGPTIQKAVTEALKNSITFEQCMADIHRLREDFPEKPIYLMTYMNPIFRRGIQQAAKLAAEAGLDGFIIPDLPHISSPAVASHLHKYGMGLVRLVSNNLPPERMKVIARASDDFVYAISTLGVTGARDRLDPALSEFLQTLKPLSPRPVLVGFGIAQPEHIKQLRGLCDGVIVGSAILKIVMEHPTDHREQLLKWLQNMLSCR